MLLDSKGNPVLVVTKYLKYLDQTGKAGNTLKSYCYHLKLYFQFLVENKLNYKDINLNVLAYFIGWLRNPHQSTKILTMGATKEKRSKRTVNTDRKSTRLNSSHVAITYTHTPSLHDALPI